MLFLSLSLPLVAPPLPRARVLPPAAAAAMGSYIDRSKTTRSKDYRGSGSFATFMIIGREFSGGRWYRRCRGC